MTYSKCRVCREPAIIDLPRHNANFCTEHLLQLCRRPGRQGHRRPRHARAKHDRVLVAVSGGKDSLAVWDILIEIGYEADGLYIGLGIGEYSDVSRRLRPGVRRRRGLRLVTVDLRDEYGYDVPTAAKVTKRVPCSACGMSKRHIFDEPRSRAGTTWWSRATTSTTRRRCCSATRCDGTSSTWPVSSRSCRRATGSRRR
jgi:tRNA-5-methyluridine54 2-sulfurtransferase